MQYDVVHVIAGIFSCFAGFVEIHVERYTVFLSGPMTLALIPWACLSTVSSVVHSFVCATMSGGVPTCMVGKSSLPISELYADYDGIFP